MTLHLFCIIVWCNLKHNSFIGNHCCQWWEHWFYKELGHRLMAIEAPKYYCWWQRISSDPYDGYFCRTEHQLEQHRQHHHSTNRQKCVLSSKLRWYVQHHAATCRRILRLYRRCLFSYITLSFYKYSMIATMHVTGTFTKWFHQCCQRWVDILFILFHKRL